MTLYLCPRNGLTHCMHELPTPTGPLDGWWQIDTIAITKVNSCLYSIDWFELYAITLRIPQSTTPSTFFSVNHTDVLRCAHCPVRLNLLLFIALRWKLCIVHIWWGRGSCYSNKLSLRYLSSSCSKKATINCLFATWIAQIPQRKLSIYVYLIIKLIQICCTHQLYLTQLCWSRRGQFAHHSYTSHHSPTLYAHTFMCIYINVSRSANDKYCLWDILPICTFLMHTIPLDQDG